MQQGQPGNISKIYFPGLNGLRFVAAFLVVIHHIEQGKQDMNLPNLFNTPFINSIGGLGVDLFFVLSGFLITYLLIAEKETFKDIQVLKFYLRRILRIWPLYFLIVLSGLFILPHITFLHSYIGNNIWEKLILFCLILPNVVLVGIGETPYISQTWSIGVEEQFYLVWPLLIKYTKNYLVALFGVIIFMKLLEFLLPHGLSFLQAHQTAEPTQHVLSFLIRYLLYFRISCMAIGGVGAYLLYFKQDKVLNIIYRRDVQAIVLLASLPLLYIAKLYAHSIIFCFIIVNVAGNPKSILKLNTKWLEFLGKISYGIYMYHSLAIGIVFYLLHSFSFQYNDAIANIALYISTFVLTISMSAASYYLFEKRFLNLKKPFTRIESGG